MLRRIIAAVTVVSLIAMGSLLFTTSPSSAGPLGILAFFVFMYLATLGALTFLFHGVSTFATRFAATVTGKSRAGTFTFRRSYYYASVAALAPVMLVAMQSVNQVGVYQLLLVVFFIAVAWIYITKRTV